MSPSTLTSCGPSLTSEWEGLQWTGEGRMGRGGEGRGGGGLHCGCMHRTGLTALSFGDGLTLLHLAAQLS
jgi:hypothetical protein